MCWIGWPGERQSLLCALVGFPMIGWVASGCQPAGALLGLGVWGLWVCYLTFARAVQQRMPRIYY